MQYFYDLIEVGAFSDAKEALDFLIENMTENDLLSEGFLTNIDDAEYLLKLVEDIQNDITLLMLSLEKPGVTTNAAYKRFLSFELKMDEFTEFHQNHVLHGKYQEIEALIKLKGVKKPKEFDDIDFIYHCTIPADDEDVELIFELEDLSYKGPLTYPGMEDVSDSEWREYLDPEKYSQYYEKHFYDENLDPYDKKSKTIFDKIIIGNKADKLLEKQKQK